MKILEMLVGLLRRFSRHSRGFSRRWTHLYFAKRARAQL